MKQMLRNLSLSCLLLLSVGCISVRTIYVPPRTPIRLRQDINDVKIWVSDKDGKWVESTLDLKEGWYVVSDEK